ncbi:MAG: preprotein translocase subunit YajC [Spirochaetales bacterium]|nr:preprotein translocase subunit YajC [Spirochaetales bacterium]MBP7264372.1 preprotein translocase subunit YajC [Spirochaetia bacterium]
MDKLFSGLSLIQDAAAPAASPTSSMLNMILMFGAVFAIFYFMIIRPQNKKQKEMQKKIEAVKKGDKIVTIGGIHGIVHSVKERTVVLKVDDQARMEFSKSAIAHVEAQGDAAEAPAEAKDASK